VSDKYGSDGYGPPPSDKVAEIRDRFFGDGPPPHDPELAARIAEQIRRRNRTISWKKT